MASLCVWAYTKVWQKIWKNFFTRGKWEAASTRRQKREGKKTKNCWQGKIFSSSTLLSRLSPIDILSSVFYFSLHTNPPHHFIITVEWSGKSSKKNGSRKILHFPFAARSNRMKKFSRLFFCAAVRCWEFGKLFDDVEEILVWRKFFSVFLFTLYFLVCVPGCGLSGSVSTTFDDLSSRCCVHELFLLYLWSLPVDK